MFTLISIPSLVTTLKITSEKEKSWMEISQKTESDFNTNTRLDFKWKNRVSLIILEPLYVDLIQINVNHQRQGHKTPTATFTQQNMEHNVNVTLINSLYIYSKTRQTPNGNKERQTLLLSFLSSQRSGH